jgi:hypothetical protein
MIALARVVLLRKDFTHITRSRVAKTLAHVVPHRTSLALTHLIRCLIARALVRVVLHRISLMIAHVIQRRITLALARFTLRRIRWPSLASLGVTSR